MVRLLLSLIFAKAIFITGCANYLPRSFSDNISSSILNQNDPDTVRDGAPAYMLMLDGFIHESPEDAYLLKSAADLYGSYAMVFAQEPIRIQKLSDKSLAYSRRALCLSDRYACGILDQPYNEFVNSLAVLKVDALPFLYSYAASWVAWVRAHSDDWHARAEMPKITALLQRLAELEPPYKWGRAELYLAVLKSQLPPAMGGEPEQAREHFETAIQLSASRDLIGKVYYARYYARLVFDQALHDRLLEEVINANPDYPGLTLSNVIAQDEAHRLLAESEEYFGE